MDAAVRAINNVVDLSFQPPRRGDRRRRHQGPDDHLRPGDSPLPYARAYVSPGGDKPYVTITPLGRSGRCAFGDLTVYVLRLLAPRGFGCFGGDLVAPDEISGHLYAIPPNRSGARSMAPLRVADGRPRRGER
jgi:hypothetical protein